MFVLGGRYSGRGGHKGGRMRRPGRLVQQDIWQAETRRSEASGSDPFVQLEFVQLSQEAVVSVRMQSTESVRLSRMTED